MKFKKASINPIIFNLSWQEWLFAALLIMTGLLFIEEGSKEYLLVCRRTGEEANTCKIHNSQLSGTEIQQFQLNQLKEARFDKSPQSEIVTVTLITEQGTIKFGSLSNAHEFKKKAIASEINRFLQNPQQSAVTVKEPYSFSTIFSGIAISLGASLLFFKKVQ